jgi:Phage integrase, N-terminal SAM-like domain
VRLPVAPTYLAIGVAVEDVSTTSRAPRLGDRRFAERASPPSQRGITNTRNTAGKVRPGRALRRDTAHLIFAIAGSDEPWFPPMKGWVTKEAVMASSTTAVLVRYDDPAELAERAAVAGFLAGCTGNTLTSYTTDLRLFATWCAANGMRLLAVKWAHLELFARHMEAEGRMRSTVARRL